MVKEIMRKIKEERSSFEEPLAVFRNTRNESGYSPNQLRNWSDPNFPDEGLLKKFSQRMNVLIN